MKNISYEKPYSLQQIKQKYSNDIYQKLKNDPIHKWRAETGIELIHKEPTNEQLQRIWKNWQLMSKKQKQISDQKSLELFNMTNKDHYIQLTKETNLNNKIQQIKQLLMKYKNCSTWKEYIDKLKYGDCDFIAGLVQHIYPKAEYIEIQQNFSSLAIEKLHKLGDDGEMWGNHFINKIDDKFYDFGKGTNTINGVYLLCYTPNQNQKYNVELTQEERKTTFEYVTRINNRTLYKKEFKNKVK